MKKVNICGLKQTAGLKEIGTQTSTLHYVGGERKRFFLLHVLTLMLVMSGPKARRWKTLHHFYWLLGQPCKLTQKNIKFYAFYLLFETFWQHVDDHRKPRPTTATRYDASISDATHARMCNISRGTDSPFRYCPSAGVFLTGTLECLA